MENKKVIETKSNSIEEQFYTDNVLVKQSIDKTDGIILGRVGDDVISIPKTSKINSNVAIIGKKGADNYASFLRNTIFQCCDCGESMVITDQSGGLYNDTALFLQQKGYEIKQFNIEYLGSCDAWNCLLECISQGEENVQLFVQKFTSDIIRNTRMPGSGSGDSAVFDAVEGSLLSALCLITLLQPDGSIKPELIDAFNHKTLISDSLCTVVDLLSNQDEMENRFQELRIINPDHPAFKPYSSYDFLADNVKGIIISSLSSRLQVLQADIAQEIVGYYDIDLELPAKRPCAYFIIGLDQINNLKFLVPLFFSFMFMRIANFAKNCHNQEQPIPVNFILDELCELGATRDFEKAVSSASAYNMRFFLFFQSLAQLEKAYSDNEIQEILNNCDAQVYLGGNDLKTTEYFLKKCDEQIVVNFADGTPITMTINKFQKIKDNELVVFISGYQPILLNACDCLQHPDAYDLIPCSFKEHEPVWREPFARKRAAKIERIKLISQGNISG